MCGRELFTLKTTMLKVQVNGHNNHVVWATVARENTNTVLQIPFVAATSTSDERLPAAPYVASHSNSSPRQQRINFSAWCGRRLHVSCTHYIFLHHSPKWLHVVTPTIHKHPALICFDLPVIFGSHLPSTRSAWPFIRAIPPIKIFRLPLISLRFMSASIKT